MEVEMASPITDRYYLDLADKTLCTRSILYIYKHIQIQDMQIRIFKKGI